MKPSLFSKSHSGMNKYDRFITIKAAEGSMNAFRDKTSDE